jgi:hypothetical protein
MRYLLAIIIFCFFSCKDDNKHDSVLGQWQCEEYYESGGYQKYMVSILHDPLSSDTNNYVISNFYQMGSANEAYVRFKLKGDSILKFDQIVLTNSITDATGTVASDFSEIKLHYHIQTSTKSEYVEATYY